MSSHEELAEEAQVFATKADRNSSGDRYVAQTIPKLILSNGRVEKAINDFQDSTAKTEKRMQDLASAQVKLARAQVVLAVAAIIVTVILAVKFG